MKEESGSRVEVRQTTEPNEPGIESPDFPK